MSETLDQTVTRLLSTAALHGDRLVVEELVPLLYQELRQLARRQLAHSPSQTLQATALVNEVFMRLVDRRSPAYENRAHFFFAAGRAMRDILVEHARRRRGASIDPSALAQVQDEAPIQHAGADELSADLLALHAALQEFEAIDPERARIVVLRYFAGLNMDEIATATGIPLRTVERSWRFARAWLHSRLTRTPSDPTP